MPCVLHTQGYIVGCGLSGCATSTLSFLSQLRAASATSAHTPADVAPAAFLYFACSAGITGLCTLSFSLLTRLKYSRMKLEPYVASEWRMLRVASCCAESGQRVLSRHCMHAAALCVCCGVWHVWRTTPATARH
jgi:hypothetical protein